MSNSLAMAAVTATVRDLLLEAMQTVQPLSGAPFVQLGRPEARPRTDFVGANLYLYRVAPNASFRNNNLPVRDAGGQFVAKPQVALDVYYLMTFYGQAATLEPQRLMGSAITMLERSCELTPERVRQTIEQTDFLRGADLDTQLPRVRLSMEPMSLEELSKLWTIFFQATHELSVAYQATVLLMDTDAAVVKALPVSTSRVLVGGSAPVLDKIDPAIVTAQPGVEISAEGDGLDDPSLLVRIGSTEVAPTERSRRSLKFPLPAEVVAGLNPVCIVRPSAAGPASASASKKLIVRPFLVAAPVLGPVRFPKLTSTGTASPTTLPTLQFKMLPRLGPRQKATAWLNPKPGEPATVQATSTSSLLRALLPLAVQSELDGASNSPRLQSAFRAAGLSLPPQARITIRKAGSSWTIFDPQSKAHYWISRVEDVLMLLYGIAAANPEGWAAFDLTAIPPGQYLVRIQIGGERQVETGLQTDPTTGGYTGPVIDLGPTGGAS